MVQFKLDTSACVTKIMATGKVSQDDAQAILQEVAYQGQKLRAEKGISVPFFEAAQAMADRLMERAKLQSDDAVRNQAIRDINTARILANDSDHALHTRALLTNETTGSKENVQNYTGMKFQQWAGSTWNELRKAGLRRYARSRSAFVDIAKEMFGMEPGAEPKPGAPAYEAARIFTQTYAAIRNELNGLGANIADLWDWIGTTTHDPELMRYGGRFAQDFSQKAVDATKQWIDFIRPLLSNRTFDDVIPIGDESIEQARTRFLNSVFDALYTGRHFSGPADFQGTPYEGMTNVARRISEGRVLHFKDGESWAKYMQNYGRSVNMLEVVQHAILNGARNAGVMKYLGTNPVYNMTKIVDEVTKALRKIDKDKAEAYTGELSGGPFTPSLRDLMYQVGARPSESPLNLKQQIRQRRWEAGREFYDTAVLGNVAATHFYSLPTTFYLAGKGLGMNAFQSLATIMRSMIPDLNIFPRTEAYLNAMSEMGALVHGLDARNAFKNGFSVPGAISSMYSTFMTATGLPWVMRHAKQGFVWMLANRLVNRAGREFAQLTPEERSTFGYFGIDSAKWNIIRTMARTEGPEGLKFIVPEDALEVPDERIRQVLGPQATDAEIAAYKREISDQLGMMYTRFGQLATVTPGPRERALLFGQKPAGWQNLFWQFTSWPLAAQHQLLAKTFYESQSKKKGMWALGVAAGLSMLAGYIRLSQVNLVNGRPLEEPQNAAQAAGLMIRSMAAGGIGGVLLDKIVADVFASSREGHLAVGGPFTGDLNTAINIIGDGWRAMAQGKDFNPLPDLAHWFGSRIPFANLFYLKGAINYLTLYHLYEAVDPGWWDRVNQKRQRAGEASYAGYSPGAPIPFNPLTPITGTRQ